MFATRAASLLLLIPGCAFVDAGDLDARRDPDRDGSPNAVDCGPLDPHSHPGADEIRGDAVDQNCDGLILRERWGSGAADALATAIYTLQDGEDAPIGAAVGGDGDQDGDGLASLLIGAPDADRLFVVTGGATGPQSISGALDPPVVAILRGDGGQGVGSAFAEANGAGLLLGLPGYTVDDVEVGAICLHTGEGLATGGVRSATRDAERCLTGGDDLPPSWMDLAPYSLGWVAESAGTAPDHLLIGAPDPSGSAPGAAVLVDLSDVQGDTVQAATGTLLVGETAGDLAGWVSVGVGDLDGDGVGDWAVSAPGPRAVDEEQRGDSPGRVYLGTLAELDGLGAALALADLATVEGATAGDTFGAAVVALPDLGGDGLPELLIGAPLDSDGAGRVWLLPGDAERLSGAVQVSSGLTVQIVPTTNKDGAHMGATLANVGDLDEDGLVDIAIGRAGLVALLYGSDALSEVGVGATLEVNQGADQDADAVWDDTDAGTGLGRSINGAGDLDGDGAADLVIGAPAWAGDDGELGAALVFSGAVHSP